MGRLFFLCSMFMFTVFAAAPDFFSWDARLSEVEKKLESLESGRATAVPQIFQARLTTAAATPVTTTDQTSAGTIYLTPYAGSTLSLYNGTGWQFRKFTEISLALSGLTSGKNYDVFVYNNSGTLTLALSAAWASDTTRTDALTLQDGVYVKSGSTSYRYVGTLRTTSTTTTEDSVAKRFVWNYYNRVPRKLLVTDATNSWSYSTTSWRNANNSSANRVEFVVGIQESLVTARALLHASSTSTYTDANTGVGLDSSITDSSLYSIGGLNRSAEHTQLFADYTAHTAIGYHYLQLLEKAGGSANIYYGDNNNPAVRQSGLIGWIQG